MSLCFILKALGSKGLTWLNLCFRKLILEVARRIDWHGKRPGTQRPVGRLIIQLTSDDDLNWFAGCVGKNKGTDERHVLETEMTSHGNFLDVNGEK